MEERREMNGQRMMTKEELESRVPRLNSILKERQEDFALEYTQKPVNNGMRRGYMFKNDSPISMAVYQREDWGLMSDAQLADLLVDLARQFDVKEKSEEIAKTVNGILTDKDVLIYAYPMLVSEENSFQVALRSALSELKDGSMVELSERDPGFRQSEMEEHLAEQDWLKISHEIPQELRDVTDRFIRAVRVHACDQVDTAYLAGMRDMMKIAAAFGLYEIDPDDVLPTRQRK